ncbi:type II toxin-antitoxin system PemK/MazF family toxin [Stagnimonas aquatica]|uniref:mRNA interferase n=1 Tax=Stagnimonas aquatica TaxID=2689987 RepID=A0A3N0VBA9_9GAMM|nr:type II toxin-antitoxin system PemK/MazF family toxin [Stagnimonas aquatica]ROH89558.1 type II toxin-antitoxin system PemK/MazF family toxin [Stagnimonas aquatica]
MQRGELWWVNLDPTLGSEIRKTRPCVILSVDALNRARRTVVVVPLTSSATPRPPIVLALPSAGEGIRAVCDQVRTVDKQRLLNKSGRLTTKDMNQLEAALRQVLGL